MSENKPQLLGGREFLEPPELLQLLDVIERELKSSGLWSGKKPGRESFQSTLPFFCDTMRFEEWVQWVYIARFRQMIENDQALPKGSDVAPMAEECFNSYSQNCLGVVNALREFDTALSKA